MVDNFGADAVIISDPGLFDITRQAAPNLDIHISTQANNTNYASANMWYKLGAKRVILARELSLAEIFEIRQNIPEDLEIAQLTAQEQVAGIILVGYHWDITLQLRVFSPEVMTWEDFKTTIEAEATADVQFLGADGSILYYRNTAPSASSELAGIALTGLDGRLYKISVFTGMMEDFSPEAKVWEMAELIADHTSQMDFSQWPLKEQQ